MSLLKVFISYAREDDSLRQEFSEHLALLKREEIIHPWHDRKIIPGEDARGQLDDHLEAADLIVLLVSSSFLSSDYCFNVETTRALERDAIGEARVIPIIVRPCDWRTAPFSTLETLPKDGVAVTQWNNRDEAWLDVAMGLRAAIEEMDQE